MLHVRGLGLTGCLILAVLVSLVHSQHGKGPLEAWARWRMWNRPVGWGFLAKTSEHRTVSPQVDLRPECLA